ncbi:MAG TPA: aminopeptidase P family protein [Gemmatimonadetes bacterium]|nr:aminopeptidase P family protein [Gemmatimonadota bacterium]
MTAITMSDSERVARVQSALREAGIEGWLFFHFRGQNTIAKSMLGLGWTSRRSFTLIPAEGDPVTLIHAIEHSSWRHWPWEIIDYAGWREMESRLAEVIGGRKRLAMEVSPRSSVPTLDHVPSGILELLEGAGVEPVSSGDLVSVFHSVWSEEQLEAHRASAETIRAVAMDAFARAAEHARLSDPLLEGQLGGWIRDELKARGMPIDADAHVAIGRNAADPHYDPRDAGSAVARGEVLLIDLWARPSEDGVFADQTWMAILSDAVPERLQTIWDTVKGAREAGIDFLRSSHEGGRTVRGYEVDDVCRGFIDDRSFGEFFVHRTGHSMDLELHGSGPNLDNLETRDDRLLVHGVGFSIEPGIYVPGEVGVRSEINVHWGADGPEVTPRERQDEMLLLLNG